MEILCTHMILYSNHVYSNHVYSNRVYSNRANASMGWLWLVGWIKLQVSFAKETYKRDNILQKRPIILPILLTVATPYHAFNALQLHLLSNVCVYVCVCVFVRVFVSVCK